LSNLEFDTPTGPVKLDERREGIANIFLTEVVEGPNGNLVNKTIKVIHNVNQTLGLPYKKFLEYGQVGRNNPPCN
jgi:branched-chain amino acid transport system substrate-binding protein